ncbi:hypothetical protein N9B89_03410 [Flavobacteriales bacterium]|nr:hypothetical protein [Flavobacteriales bacterium]
MALLVGGLFFLFFIAIIIPEWFIIYLPFSGLSDFFANNIIYRLISAVVILYFIFTGTFYYTANIDPYVIQITSYRVLLTLFKKKDYVDIPHTMLRDYSFFDRPFSFNKTLMLKIETQSGKKVAKRFSITLLSENEIERISEVLDRIIVKNN